MEIPKGHYIFGTVKVGERGQIGKGRGTRSDRHSARSARQVRHKGGRHAHCARRREMGDRCDKVGCIAKVCSRSL